MMGGGMMGGYSSMMEMMRQLTNQAGSPEKRFLEAVSRATWIAGALAVGVALLLGLLISRQITAPLRRITLAAQRVARGDSPSGSTSGPRRNGLPGDGLQHDGGESGQE